MQDTIGIDVSKDWLDAYSMARSEHRRFAYDGIGLRVYHRRLENSLSEEAVPYSKVNPRQARRFAEATGKIAKTDKVDAAILANMAPFWSSSHKHPKPNISTLSKS